MSDLDDPYNAHPYRYEAEDSLGISRRKGYSGVKDGRPTIVSVSAGADAGEDDEELGLEEDMYGVEIEDASDEDGDQGFRSSTNNKDFDTVNGATTTPTSTRPSSPHSAYAHSPQHCSGSDSPELALVDDRPAIFASSSSPDSAGSHSGSSGSGSGSDDPDDTPPLTPDSFSALSLTSSIHSQLLQGGFGAANGLTLPHAGDRDEERFVYSTGDDEDAYEDQRYHLGTLGDFATQNHSSAVKEGKRPERPICYDTLIDDISATPFTTTNSNNNNYTATNGYDYDYPAAVVGGIDYDESNEWYGLEYTLELSCRERRAQEVDFTSLGEHSKSRESWAALHLGTIDPYYEEEEFYHWRRWHYFLEVQEQRRKERRTHEFLKQSFDYSWLYLEDVRTVEVLVWQKEQFGKVRPEVLERLEMIAEYRPDPYIPPQPRNLAWFLKRSRSVSCLQELRRDFH